MTAASDAEQRGWALSMEKDRWYTEQLAAKGMQVAAPSAQLKADLAKVGEIMTAEWVKTAGAVGDTVLMLQYATYSVISPEGCASILWKSADKAPEAAETLAITATRLKSLGLIDRIVPEPVGAAHRDPAAVALSLKKALLEALKPLRNMDADELIEARYTRLMTYGKFREVEVS